MRGRVPGLFAFFWNLSTAAGSILVYKSNVDAISVQPAGIRRCPTSCATGSSPALVVRKPRLPQRKEVFLYSYGIVMLSVALVIWSSHWAFEHREEIKQQVVSLATDISPYMPMTVSRTAGRRRRRR